MLASGGDDGTVRLWEAGSGSRAGDPAGHTGGVRGVALSADGRLLASGGLDGMVRLWEARARRLAGHPPGAHRPGLRCGAVRGRAAAGQRQRRRDGPVVGRGQQCVPAHPAGATPPWSGAWRCVGTGGWLASGSVDGTVELWEAGSGACLRTLHGHTGGVWAVALSGTGGWLASGSADGTVSCGRCAAVPVCTRCGAIAAMTAWISPGLTGVTAGQRATLLALGALDRTPADVFCPQVPPLRQPSASY